MAENLIDAYERKINYLRISVTDRCNLKCLYCRPRQGFRTITHKDVLRYEEIARLVDIFCSLGVRKVRISGGEPLVRKGIDQCIQMISNHRVIKDLALSTNGIYLGPLAQSLKRAGLHRVNISLDTLKPERFSHITGLDSLHQVLSGIDKALEAGLRPVKINAVLMKGINDDEIEDFAQLSLRWPVEVRFIELMPMRNCFERGEQYFYSNRDAKKRIENRFELIKDQDAQQHVAQMYRIRDGYGKLGFISPLSESFCRACNRVRLTANGFLRLCLHEAGGIDLRAYLRNGSSSQSIKNAILESMRAKPEKHRLNEAGERHTIMTQIGG
ncbi:MAG: GTP 3',8-cyclase MoaA [Chlamydiota bacterium]|nr:GTP 3',8-cyclase MoaA [Chlamydiota bacterium]